MLRSWMQSRTSSGRVYESPSPGELDGLPFTTVAAPTVTTLTDVATAAVTGASVSDVNARLATINDSLASLETTINAIRSALADHEIMQP